MESNFPEAELVRGLKQQQAAWREEISQLEAQMDNLNAQLRPLEWRYQNLTMRLRSLNELLERILNPLAYQGSSRDEEQWRATAMDVKWQVIEIQYDADDEPIRRAVVDEKPTEEDAQARADELNRAGQERNWDGEWLGYAIDRWPPESA